MDKITIIGTGLIGTSLGLAIKAAGTRGAEIVGTDLVRGHASKAESMGAVDRVAGNLISAVEDARFVIIATPVMEIRIVLEIIGPRLAEGCLVTDTGSSKGVVMEWAQQYLPPGVSFVGGNPMVSKEGSGPGRADATLFQGHPYCVIPASSAQQRAVRDVTDMVRSIGARPYFIAVAEHDSFVCAVSQLPVLLSVALLACTSKSPSWDDIAQIASVYYRDFTKPASGDPGTHRDILLANDQGLVHWIDTFIHELHGLRQLLTGDEKGRREALEKVLRETFEERDRWLAGAVTPASQAAANRVRIPSASEGMSDLFMGSSETRRRLFGWGARDDKDRREKR